jgi:hypothetical protein
LGCLSFDILYAKYTIAKKMRPMVASAIKLKIKVAKVLVIFIGGLIGVF